MTCEWKIFCKQGDACVAHDGYDILRCTAFKDKEVPTTNEEWFASLSTEEKAEVLSNIAYSSAAMSTDILCLPKEAETKKWELWLNEVHKE